VFSLPTLKRGVGQMSGLEKIESRIKQPTIGDRNQFANYKQFTMINIIHEFTMENFN